LKRRDNPTYIKDPWKFTIPPQLNATQSLLPSPFSPERLLLLTHAQSLTN
jgi:hypothetical protein